MRTLRYWPVVLGALLALGLVPAATVAADSSSSPREHASTLTRQNADLAARSRGVVLELYSLDARLARERARLVTLRIRTAEVKGELAAAHQRLRVAQHTLKASERSLASRLALLYEQGDTDPLAVVLGATSIADALGNLDSLDRIADQDRVVIEQTRQAKHTATALSRKLAAKERDLLGLAQQASQSTLVLEQSRSQRASYLATLASRQKLNAAAIAAYQQQALAVEAKAREVAAVLPHAACGADPDRSGRPLADGLRHRLLDPRPHRNRRADRLGRRRRRSERDPARHAPDDPGLRLRRGRRHGLGDPGRDDRPLVPDGRAGARLGPPHRHDLAALTRLLPAPRGVVVSETVQLEDERTASSVRVLLVDDHDLFRTGLRNLLEERGVQIAGEAGQGADAVRLVRELAPDVVVMDLHMPGMTGIEAIRQIHGFAPLTRVLVLTISDQDDDVLHAILAGACGYLLKDASVDELIRGIVAASVGESLVSPAIAGKVLQQVRATAISPEAADTIRAELSDRELDVLKLIAAGNDNAMIAAQLHISPKTVKNHISNILMKLQIENRIQAAVYAVRSGLV